MKIGIATRDSFVMNDRRYCEVRLAGGVCLLYADGEIKTGDEVEIAAGYNTVRKRAVTELERRVINCRCVPLIIQDTVALPGSNFQRNRDGVLEPVSGEARAEYIRAELKRRAEAARPTIQGDWIDDGDEW